MQKDQQKLEQLIKGKKVAFIGAGVSHKTLIREFVEMGAQVTLCDQKKSVEDFGDYAATIRELGIGLSLGENYLDGFKGQDIIMRTPGFVGYFEKPLQDAMAAGTMVTSEVELFFDFCPCEIVAVTGSDGKTTTTTLISKFFEAAGRKVHLGGNIGAALLPMLPEVSPDDVAVVELSSFQLISMHKSPNVAVVTNVTPNHLDHHKDMQEYIDAKRNILLYQNPPCRAVLGYENEISRSMQKDCKGKQVWFTRLHDTDNGAFLRSDGMLCMAEDGVVTPFLAQKDVKLRGLHNIENLLAAAAAVWGQVPVEAIQKVGSTFTGVEHRIEPVRVLDGVTWYNDSIASSPTRTIAGLRSFNQKVILIAGGYDKKIPYEPLAPEVIRHVKLLILMGATGPRIEKAVREHPDFNETELPILHAANMKEAVELARANAKPGDEVTMSPASASFDLYPNFEVRGRDYKNIVNSLK
ncbi:MAG: UDP-N-acetylmuramoyl-L-alanine--D-glutamate ligase [Faecalibacterium prausnitzii]|nr:UDP-N-acetylmuramoyl-L-alanine--D-glutamate ligase [Faecalibacterium prausnitzii]MDD7152302.1 UDP-N-acetylmuramoyl-L-alanine--D-glutamate ligase [Faecalibacterium prausnitzii]